MDEKYFVLTNNPLIKVNVDNEIKVEEHNDLSAMEILILSRDRIHLGDSLVSHPMPGRIRPNETPYKTILMECGEGKIDNLSLLIIEDSIAMQKKYEINSMQSDFSAQILSDLQFIDWELLKSSLNELFCYNFDMV